VDTLVVQTRCVRETCFQTEAALMAELARGQHPSLLYIGCSDSRILPSHILDALIEANVLLQLEHLRSYPFIAEEEQAGRLCLHGWVYDLTSERVRAYTVEDGCFVEEPPLSV
jgi:carbonic anhydrase